MKKCEVKNGSLKGPLSPYDLFFFLDVWEQREMTIENTKWNLFVDIPTRGSTAKNVRNTIKQTFQQWLFSEEEQTWEGSQLWRV